MSDTDFKMNSRSVNVYPHQKGKKVDTEYLRNGQMGIFEPCFLTPCLTLKPPSSGANFVKKRLFMTLLALKPPGGHRIVLGVTVVVLCDH